MGHRKRRHDNHERFELPERDHQAQQKQQVIDAIEDVEKPFLRKQVEGLVPPRIQVDDAGVGVDVEGALGLAGLQEAQHDVDLQAEPGQRRADRKIGLIGGDRVLERDVEHALFPVDVHALRQPFTRQDVRARGVVGLERASAGSEIRIPATRGAASRWPFS